MEAITVDICAACHPFFTGEMKFVDRQGRVDKFMQKMQIAAAKQATKGKKSNKADKEAKEEKSYQEILRAQKSQLRDQSTEATASAAQTQSSAK